MARTSVRKSAPFGFTGSKHGPFFTKGASAGAVSLSTKHTLAIVCHEGARARDVVGFARHIRDTVADRFDVRLVPEPVLWGGLSLES